MTPLIPALIFLLIGLALLAVALRLLFTAAFGSKASISSFSLLNKLSLFKSKNKLGKMTAMLEKIGSSAEITKPYMAQLKDCLLLSESATSEAAVQQIHEHHQQLLELLVELSERRAHKLSNLPVLEELFSNRTRLFTELNETRLSMKEILKKQKDKGRDTPNWASSAFDKKAEILQDKLQTNARSIEREFEESIKQLSQSRSSSIQSTYH